MDWQPIETAPKDGTVCLLWGVWAGEISGIAKNHGGPFVGYFHAGLSDYPGDDWWELQDNDCYATWCRPTHWMPLPEPPK